MHKLLTLLVKRSTIESL